MKKVSVIIPTYNEEDYLPYCIRALRNQDYKEEYEIIVSDGGSKDNTVKIAKKLADKVIVCRKRGVSVGRNKGASIAEGELLIFVDADTIVMPNLISEFVKAVRKKDVVGVTCPILPDSMKIHYQFFFHFASMFIKSSLWTKKPQVFGLCCGYKRDAFEKVNGFDERLKTVEDLDLSVRIAEYGKIVFTDKTFVITSVRRIKRWGAIKSIRKYVSNYLNYILRSKPFTLREYRPVRKV